MCLCCIWGGCNDEENSGEDGGTVKGLGIQWFGEKWGQLVEVERVSFCAEKIPLRGGSRLSKLERVWGFFFFA